MLYSKIENNQNIHIGINNKFFQLPFIHPWLSFLVIYSFIMIISSINSNIDKLKYSVIISLPVCIILILLVMFYHRNTCFKLSINTEANKISFYKMFTNTTVVKDINEVRVEIGREIFMIAETNKYRIITESLHDVVSYLPADTEIIFKGFFGRQFKKDIENKNRPLTPGQAR